MSPDQWRILSAILDTIIPSIKPFENAISTIPSGPAILDNTFANAIKGVRRGASSTTDSDVLAVAYLAESATSCPDFRDSVNRLLGSYMDSKQKQDILFILSALKYVLIASHDLPVR